MAHTIPNSISNFTPSPRTYVLTKKTNFLARYSFARKLTGRTLPFEKYGLPLSTSIKLFPQFQSGCNLRPKLLACEAFAAGTDVPVEESDLSQVDVKASTNAETTEKSTTKPEANTTPARRSRSARKSEMPPVKNEELVPGAIFAGKVRSIHPFGAFVDFGAFSEGLVHVSQLSDSFVKDVANVVSVGQEVKVRLVEANMETGRISLSMRESNDPSKQQQKKDEPISNDKSRPPRKTSQRNTQKNDELKRSKFVQGQELVGTVKNLVRAGAFISLPEGEEGFLPQSEEADEGFASMMGSSSLTVEQEVNVRVLRITRGKITLTMKKEEADEELDSMVIQGVVHTATNPFVLAFRSNKEISAFLDEKQKDKEPEKDPPVETKDVDTVFETDGAFSETIEKEESLELIPDDSQSNDIELGNLTEASSGVLNDDISPSNEDPIAEEPAPVEAIEIKEAAQISSELVNEPLALDSIEDSTDKPFTSPSDTKVEVEANISGELTQGTLLSEISEESADVESADALSEGNQKSVEVDAKVHSGTEGFSDFSEEPFSESQQVVGTETNYLIEPSLESDNSIPTTSQEEEIVASNSEEHEHEDAGQTKVKGIQAETAAEEDKSSEVSSPIVPTIDSVTKATSEKATTISPALVKQLREETGAGMMDCKNALSESGGDIVKAQEYLRKKGLASADKKASRATAEGRIGSYIHDSRIGVLIEVNCETDFVARGDIFKGLVDDLAMQVAACPQVQYVTAEDIPTEIVNKEREIEMQKEDLMSKPEQIRSKIVDGRVKKRMEELGLLEQPFIKDDKVVVKDWVKQTISTVGENIKVKRFVRYNLGEGLEKRSHDFAAEVAAQTAAKSVPTQVKQDPAAAEVEVIVEKPEKVSISAALVKKLREETGSGMMDCKKALSETGGDYEKAQEYLRKKGLSSADKKSSRLAAEGRIGSYLHDSRIGVLIEVNCETDFVGRSQPFKEFSDDLAMQVVAFPQVQYVSIEDIPESIVNKEKQLEMLREDLQSKPENIREKIVEGRITKRLGERALLEQPFIKNDSVLVKDLVKQTVATLGENVKVRRFVRFTLGETGDAKVEAEA